MRSWLETRPTILPQISILRQKYPGYAITLVGHSLAGLEMRLKGWDITVTTFGEPMIGNGALAAFINEQFGLGAGISIPPLDPLDGGMRFRRVTHVGDPVPMLPLAEWGYRPHAGEVFIKREGLPPRRGGGVLVRSIRGVLRGRGWRGFWLSCIGI